MNKRHKTAVLTLDHAANSHEVLLHTDFWALPPVPHSAGVGCSWRICISRKLPGGADAAGSETALWEPIE